jgi:hypothetical protein
MAYSKISQIWLDYKYRHLVLQNETSEFPKADFIHFQGQIIGYNVQFRLCFSLFNEALSSNATLKSTLQYDNEQNVMGIGRQLLRAFPETRNSDHYSPMFMLGFQVYPVH